MRATIIFLLAFCSGLCAQSQPRTDTVQPGYYIPFAANVMSCHVTIAPKGKSLWMGNTTGNRLPDSLILKIANLPPGSVVAYTSITIFNAGILEKAPAVRYVVGSTNAVSAVKSPLIVDTLPAADIAAVVLDEHVYSFHVTYAAGGAYYVYKQNGNGIPQEVRARIAALPSGTRVWFEAIQRKEDDGTLTTAPAKVYVVK